MMPVGGHNSLPNNIIVLNFFLFFGFYISIKCRIYIELPFLSSSQQRDIGLLTRLHIFCWHTAISMNTEDSFLKMCKILFDLVLSLCLGMDFHVLCKWYHIVSFLVDFLLWVLLEQTVNSVDSLLLWVPDVGGGLDGVKSELKINYFSCWCGFCLLFGRRN